MKSVRHSTHCCFLSLRVILFKIIIVHLLIAPRHCEWQREQNGVSSEAKGAQYYIVADDEKEF